MNNLFLFQTPPVDKTKYVLTLDKLKFEGVIGNGAFGEVSIGIHQPTGLKVAIKKLHSIDDNQRNKELYQREVDCLANLKHRFLLPFVGYTEVPPYCIVTKYIPNGSLYNALHSNTINLDPTDLTLIAYGISAGMQYLHSHKIIHRDLKTQNVLIDENNLPVIADFGSSRKQETSRAMTGLFGTTHYMAPEFIQGEEYNEKVDVYSFGLILWEMLTKKVPFSGLESAQVIYTVVIQQSRPPIPSKTPPNLAKLIECCWSPNANERPSFERITPLFENGTVEFPDCDRQKFNNVYNTFSPQLKLTRRHSNSNLLLNMPMDEIVNNIRMSRDDRNIKSFTNLLPQSYSSNLIQKANELLFSLNTNNVNLIRQALDFFESFAEDPNVLPLTVWPPFLMFICSETHPSELIKRGEALCIRFAKIYEILCDISQVADLFQFVKPNTLEIFLYVIHFLPNVIDNSIVKRLFTLLEDESCSKKAIILIIKIVQNSPNPTITKSILDKFKQDALQYSDTIGGDLILQTLVFYNFIQNDVISAYGQSKVPENVIAAYQALYTIKGQPELFSLSNVLLHITSSNEKLRNEALEFIRRYASGAVNEPLLRIIFSLFESAIKYESEKAALLLIRIASDPKRCIYVFKVGVVDSWLQAKPKVAVNLLKLYIASINSDERAKTFLSQHQLAGTYFANVLRANDENAAVACCWTLVQSKITPSLANSLMHSEFVSLLCDFMMNENTDPLKYVHFLNALAMISPHVYHSKFNEVLQVIMNMVNNKVFISYYCIITLATLSEHPETHSTLVSANIFAVLSRYNDNGESKKYQQKLFSNLKKSGFLNFA